LVSGEFHFPFVEKSCRVALAWELRSFWLLVLAARSGCSFWLLVLVLVLVLEVESEP